MALRWVPSGDGGQRQVDEALMSPNLLALQDKLDQAIPFFENNFVNWATLSAADRNTAARQAQRFCANVARLLRDQLDSPGVD